MSASGRLAALGVVLPPVATPGGAYLPAVRSGSLVFTSGQLPLVGGVLAATGKLGAEIDLPQGQQLARSCALAALAAVDELVGLDAVIRVVKVVGFVACAPGFTAQHLVLNGASELLGAVFGAVFGAAGTHARSAVGVAELPLGAPVEVELIAEVS